MNPIVKRFLETLVQRKSYSIRNFNENLTQMKQILRQFEKNILKLKPIIRELDKNLPHSEAYCKAIG